MKDERQDVEIEGKRLSVSNLGKVLYPKAGFTKAQVIDYYVRIAPLLLPHLRDRPLTLKRYPNGVDGEFFYEKNCPAHRPKWVKTEPVGDIRFCMCNDLATLVWAANLADLEMHTPLARAPHIGRPDSVVFDLDPGAPADIVQCAKVGLVLRDLFDELGLETLPKVSGSKGLQVYVPLNDPAITYDETKPFARSVAELLEERYPKLVVSNMKKTLRVGKVLVDWSQNDESRTTVSVYSLRARDYPTVSAPVSWDEVAHVAKTALRDAIVFPSDALLKRVERKGDLFAPLLTLKQKLPSI